jgi:hypothetical protein
VKVFVVVVVAAALFLPQKRCIIELLFVAPRAHENSRREVLFSILLLDSQFSSTFLLFNFTRSVLLSGYGATTMLSTHSVHTEQRRTQNKNLLSFLFFL